MYEIKSTVTSGLCCASYPVMLPPPPPRLRETDPAPPGEKWIPLMSAPGPVEYAWGRAERTAVGASAAGDQDLILVVLDGTLPPYYSRETILERPTSADR